MAFRRPLEPAVHGGTVNTNFKERIGYSFVNPALLTHAMTHRSAADPRRDMLDSNERLEFLGDRVLALVMAEWLSERFPQEREGALGKRLSVLVAAETLAKVGDAIGLPAALRIPPAEGRTGLRGRATVIADATEALIGALYLDGGLEAARGFVRREWAGHIEADPTPPMSAKSRLQEYTLGRAEGLPEYRLVSTTGPSHMPVFVVAVHAGGREAEGRGESKRAAEQAAAEAWLAGL
ncbi:ribonuclease III [Roseomonas marmotae]|uniref:Ribonuclease 3 n=1 Tax=Roseomonas marmotae TaxID=2768161 RepID=A0ABS3KAE5_9PROT|nr:ribonuclease III [Roseomonas marmotae]MBO1074440.1 ribonuclease III [Roseomonas marmotae]QTI78177.1 ribonuclease III [Roseomonas marmotae]